MEVASITMCYVQDSCRNTHLASSYSAAQPNTFVGSGNGEINTVLKDHAKTKTLVNQEKNHNEQLS